MNFEYFSALSQYAKEDKLPSTKEIEELLCLTGDELTALYRAADKLCKENLGDKLHLRGIIEFSNHCRLSCRYCGIRKGNKTLKRYRMSPQEIIDTAVKAKQNGCSTLVLQSGEDNENSCSALCRLIREIKSATDVAITLSTGEAGFGEYKLLQEAGCDRFLLRFETANRKIFHKLHPDDDLDRRLECINNIRKAGIQLGSGFMIGLPKSTLQDLAKDIYFASRLKLDMIGCGPFIAHPQTPLTGYPLHFDKEIYFKTIAILRVLNPYANIPATTAFDLLAPDGRERLLKNGANVYMPNVTPQRYRRQYQLYRDKPDLDGDTDLSWVNAVERIRGLGKTISTSKGHSQQPGWLNRAITDKEQ